MQVSIPLWASLRDWAAQPVDTHGQQVVERGKAPDGRSSLVRISTRQRPNEDSFAASPGGNNGYLGGHGREHGRGSKRAASIFASQDGLVVCEAPLPPAYRRHKSRYIARDWPFVRAHRAIRRGYLRLAGFLLPMAVASP